MENLCAHLPEKFLERLQKLYSPKEYASVLQSMQEKPLPSFRTNTLKTTSDSLQKTLEQEGVIVEKVAWYPDAFILKNKSIRELTETDAYKEGFVYIQNLSSMLPALLLDPQETDTVLDVTAAPGSKTTLLAALMHNKGKIVANDLSRPRLYKLQANLKTYGVTNTQVANIPGQAFWKKYPEQFDKTLVDVPCTMEGRIRCDDPDTYKDWSPRKIKDLAVRQQYLLRSAVASTKVGGTIVYSTCTLSPEENEGVIDWLLKREGDAITVEEITIPGLSFGHGLSEWTKAFTPQVTKTLRMMPSVSMEGFFVAKLRKHASTIQHVSPFHRKRR
jgi:tRNA (cytosine49-C5)-methyltransferase